MLQLKAVRALQALLILAAVNAAAPAGAAEGLGANWDAMLTAAKKERVVKCACPPRPDLSRLLKEGFEAAYPGIVLEPTAAPLPAFPIRVGNEQKAGMYLWDVYMFGPGPEVFELKNKGGFAPFRDYVVLPEVLDGSVYVGGLDAAFLDSEKKYIFSIWYDTMGFAINRDVLPDAKIASLQDLLDPRYAGQIVWEDPRRGGSGSNWLAFLYARFGEAGIRKMLLDQKPLLVGGLQELVEQTVHGGKGLAFTMPTYDSLIQLQRAGVKYYLESGGQTPEMAMAAVGGSSPAVFKNPPHPNATAVFVNWVLSKDGQAYISRETKANSRRTDVAAANPESLPKAGFSYFMSQTEEGLALRVEAQKIARQLVP
jgi:ABC-type Fe3+ transport system substrate-binding protein